MSDLGTVVLENFAKKHVLVLGDLMLDRYIKGSASRLSPEAPVPVLLAESKYDSLGGAANVARNIVALGATCDLAGFIGSDEMAASFRTLCADAGIGVGAVITDTSGPTVTKTRLLAGNHQLLRIDDEMTKERPAKIYDALFEGIVAQLDAHPTDAIIISDYAKGVTAPQLLSRVIEIARKREIPVFVDPKGTDYTKYAGSTLIKPNRVEMTDFAKRWGWSTKDPVQAAHNLLESGEFRWVALTLGEQGLAIVGGEEVKRIPTRAKEVYDVTGAGDTVMATLVLAYLASLSMASCAELANLSAAIGISRLGCHAVTIDELIGALSELRPYANEFSATSRPPTAKRSHRTPETSDHGETYRRTS